MSAFGKAKNIEGLVSGRLTAHWPVGKYPTGGVLWLCSCECGKLTTVACGALVRKAVRSCGCLAAERAYWMTQTDRPPSYKHRHARRGETSSEYRTWVGMINRCTNRKNKCWNNYGGRGIKVCERWLKFENFLADMGPRPKSLTLDRFPNNDGNYEPGNCRWATSRQQIHNRRNSRHRYMVEAADNPALMKSMDAMLWAREFVSMAAANPKLATDTEAVATWFESAIRSGRNGQNDIYDKTREFLILLDHEMGKRIANGTVIVQ